MKKQKLIKNLIICFVLVILMLPFASKRTNAQAAQGDIKLNVKQARIIRGNTFSLNLYNADGTELATFTSEDEEIATVDEDGTITAIECGKTRILVTIKDENGKRIAILKCSVTVGLPAISVKCIGNELVLSLGQKRVLKTLVLTANAIEKPQFYSDDPSVVTVSNTGRITAKSLGVATVYALLENGSFDTCVVSVEEEVEQVVDEILDNYIIETPVEQ